jgi:hypothetical protein
MSGSTAPMPYDKDYRRVALSLSIPWIDKEFLVGPERPVDEIDQKG